MLNMRRGVFEVIAMLLVGAVAGCGGGDSSSSPASIPTAPTPTDSVPSVTFSGTVTNIVTGARVGGATVTIGSVSATSSADGTYSLAVTPAGQASFSASASGYYTRQSAVSMTGATTINPEIIPQGDGFDLVFFDHIFRDGSKGTTRWLTQPSFEIWTQIFQCIGHCSTYEATATSVPAYFEARAREAIALVSDLTGGTVVGPVVTTKTHAVGTSVSLNPVGPGSITFMYADKFDNAVEGGRTSVFPGGAGVAFTGGLLSFSQAQGSASRNNSIYIHKMAHSVGFFPGHTVNLSLVSGPSIMGPDPVVVTIKDRLHAKILYKRPVGNMSPDRDPSGVTIN
jgi:hypothetical protein